MDIFNLLKSRDKTTKKAIKARNNLAVGIIDNLDSANRMTRVVFADAHTRWNKAEEKQLVDTFQKHVANEGVAYPLLGKEVRKEILRKTARDLGRTPSAIRIRLTSLGQYPQRKNLTAKDLKGLGKKA